MEQVKFITIVNRSTSENSFIEEIQEILAESFEYNIVNVSSLGDFFELDKKERFIAFLSQENDEESDVVEIAVTILRGKGFGVALHEDLDSALAYAKEKYEYESNSEKRKISIAKMREKFPVFSAQEVEHFSIFDALFHTGKLIPIRGRLNDELVVVLAQLANGPDEMRVTPMAIIVNEYLERDLKLPFEEEDIEEEE